MNFLRSLSLAAVALCHCHPAAGRRRTAVRGFDRPARARLHRLPRPAGKGGAGRLLPADRRQAASYLYNQLLNFRDGPPPLRPDDGLLAPLDDAYLREIATHFAGLEVAYAPPQPRRKAPRYSSRAASS
jgi:hypothetical protein